VARRRVIVGFWRKPWNRKTGISAGKVYSNRYNKEKIVKLIKKLDGFKTLKVKEDIPPREDAVYVIDISKEENHEIFGSK